MALFRLLFTFFQHCKDATLFQKAKNLTKICFVLGGKDTLFRNVPEISWVFRRVNFGGWQGSEIGA